MLPLTRISWGSPIDLNNPDNWECPLWVKSGHINAEVERSSDCCYQALGGHWLIYSSTKVLHVCVAAE